MERLGYVISQVHPTNLPSHQPTNDSPVSQPQPQHEITPAVTRSTAVEEIHPVHRLTRHADYHACRRRATTTRSRRAARTAILAALDVHVLNPHVLNLGGTN